MAKTLKAVRARLKELEPPPENSAGTKAFYKKHVYVLHDDPAGNRDDVFRATNVKTAKRHPEHGYDPGQDDDVYEEVAMTEGAFAALHASPVHKDINAWSSKVRDKHGDDVGYSTDKKKEYTVARVDGKNVGVFHHETKKGWIKEETILESITGLQVLMLTRAFSKARASAAGRTPTVRKPKTTKTTTKKMAKDAADYWSKPARKRPTAYWKEEQEPEQVDEIVSFAAAITQPLRGKSRSSAPRPSQTRKPKKKDRGELLLTPSMQDPEQKKRMADLEARIGRQAEYGQAMDRKKTRDHAKKYWGEETELNEMTDNEGFDHYLSQCGEAMNALRGSIARHKSRVLESSNPNASSDHVNALRTLHRAIEDAHVEYGRNLRYVYPSVFDRNNGADAVAKDPGSLSMPVQVARREEFDGYEHIESLGEDAQDMLFGLYNSLTEDHQDKFLELAESEDGVEELLDFAITNKGAIS